MAWVAVDRNGSEWIYDEKPQRGNSPYDYDWAVKHGGAMIELPQGSIEKIMGIYMTWESEPLELVI